MLNEHRIVRNRHRLAGFIVALLAVTSVGRAALPPGLGEVTGSVVAPKAGIVPVYLYNTQKHVGYAVFAVDGIFRAVDLFPGPYEITVRKGGLDMAPVHVDVAAGGHVRADLSPRQVPAPLDYTGGHAYQNVRVEPYDKVYPQGAGRRIVERTCIVCHGVNWLPGKAFDRAAWQAYVHYMTSETAFRSYGFLQGPSLVDPARISDADLAVLLDYLVENFGPGSTPRAVQQDKQPPVDRAALARAMYVEYRFPNTPKMPKRWTQEVHFDSHGIVYVTERGNPASIVRLDPQTAEFRDFLTPDPTSSPHGLTVDADGTVWWSGRDDFLAHLDPATGLTDEYPATESGIHGHTPVFDSKGDLWFSMLTGNKLGHWSRATDQVTYYETPAPRGHPYGLVVDHTDKVWYVEYFTDHVTRFDPETQTFRRYAIKSSPASLRRLGVDSKNIIWYGVYGTVGKAGKLGRLDPTTGEVTERDLPIEYSNPYDAWPDDQDNVWISSDNYITRFDTKTRKFTVYPVPERTDEPKIMLTRDGAIWFTPRSAGLDGYGGAASVLYPDKDAIRTLGAYYPAGSSANYIARYDGPTVKVTGVVKVSKDGPQNPQLIADRVIGTPARTPARSANEGKLSD